MGTGTNRKEAGNIQKDVFRLLCVFKEICEKENIWYSLAYGTMLGAVRHKDFIPWDDDADVMIFLPDKERFRKAFYKHKPDGIGLHNYDAEPENLQSHDTMFYEGVKNRKLILDIFPLAGAPSKRKEQQMFAVYCCFADKIVKSKYVNLKLCNKKNRPFVRIIKILEYFIPDKILKNNIKRRETKYDFKEADYLMTISSYADWKSCMPRHLFNKMIRQEFHGVEFDIPERYDIYLKRIYGSDYMIPKRYHSLQIRGY